MAKKLFVALAAAGLLLMGSTADASERVLSKVGHGRLVKPLRVAGVQWLGNGRYMMTTPWKKVTSSGEVGMQGFATQSFDNFEGDRSFGGNGEEELPTDGRYGANCGMADSRWYFGDNWCTTFIANDIARQFPGTNNQQADSADFSWFWNVTGAGSSEPCFVLVFTGETWSDTVAPGLTGIYPGVVYDFGNLQSGATDAVYYYANTDLRGTGLFHQMPSDGVGGYTAILAKAFDGTTATQATCAQFMLWGTKAANPSQQGATQWDDGGFEFGVDPDNRDGTLGAGENFDYTYGVCPDPLGASFQFSASSTASTVLPTSYTVTRGVEIGANDVAKIRTNDTSRAVVQQRFQASPTVPNAALEAVLLAGAGTPTTATLTVVIRSNALPFGDTSCRQEIGLRDWNTNAYVVVDSRKPTTADATIVLNLNATDRARFFRASDGRVEVLNRVFHLTPSSPAWSMDVNLIKFDITR